MFESLINAFNIVLYQPLFNVLVLLYQYLPGQDFGLAVIVLTIIVRLLFFPLGIRGVRSQIALQKIQPKIKEIQEKFKKDPQRQSQEMMELYRKENINPFSGCFFLLIQLPILIALYRVFWKIGPEQLNFLYPFVPHPGKINYLFFGKIDLSQPFLPLAIIAGILQFFQGRMVFQKRKSATRKSLDISDAIQKQMLYFFPIFTFFILLRLPSAIALYWLISVLFTIWQQTMIKRELSTQRD